MAARSASSRATKKRTPVQGSLRHQSGSAFRDRSRIFLPVEVTLRVDCGKKRQAGEKRHYFSWEELPRRSETDEKKPAPRANPVRIAQDWNPKLAIRFYDAILARDPIDEEAVRGIMRCHAALGDTNAVRRTYKALTTALRRELEDDAAEPLPETTRLREQLTPDNTC